MEQALAIRDDRNLVKIEDYAMSIDGLVGQVALIQRVMEKVMKENEHYGKIPGTSKPTLLKPGAEKLCLTFRLNPNYDIIEKIREKDFIAYTVRCDLTHIISQTPIASGIGSCNSRESKYRYHSQSTGKPVPKEYWDTRDPATLGGPQYSPRKKDGKWIIFEQIENANPWDLDNTLIKMACKRALIAATLNATAASDIFTQDIEDMPPEIVNAEIVQEQPAKEPEPTPGTLSLTGIIEKVEKKTGESKGKPWTRYGIFIEGNIYGTFDSKIGEQALTLEGQRVRIDYDKGEKFMTCTSIEDVPEDDRIIF